MEVRGILCLCGKAETSRKAQADYSAQLAETRKTAIATVHLVEALFVLSVN